MSIIDRLKDYFFKDKKVGFIKDNLPVNTGERQTTSSTLGSIISEHFGGLENPYPIQLVEAIEYLVAFNPDFSYAMDNIIQLSNTKSNVIFSNKLSDSLIQEMKSKLETDVDTWYRYSGGINSLRNDLLAQMVIHGVLAAEIVPSANLDGVSFVAIVNPATIVFKYSQEHKTQIPHQRNTKGVLIPLNTNTFKYYTIRRIKDSNYPVPPFLSALENIEIEKDMVSNIREVVKKLGLVGFMEVLLSPPKARAERGVNNETAYKEKARKMLEDTEVRIQRGMSNGYVIGYKGEHEFNMHNPVADASGVSELFKMNNEQKIAGLKQSPAMLGKNYTVTETFGKVVLKMLTSQSVNYQSILDKFQSDVVLLHLQLSGYKINSVSIISERPMIEDEDKEQQTFSKKIDNNVKLYNQGIISQSQFAINVGYDKPDEKTPRQLTDTNEIPTQGKVEAVRELINYNKIVEFDYDTCHGDNCTIDSFLAPKGSKMDYYYGRYNKETIDNFEQAIDKYLIKFMKEFVKLPSDVTAQEVTNLALYHLYIEWDEVFVQSQKSIINRWVDKSYNRFRKDKDFIFAGAKILKKGDKIPDGVFDVYDYRALQFFKDTDGIYLGKFITDESTKNKITKFLKKEYLEDGLTAGSRSSVRRFRSNFSGVLNEEAWKIKSILTTSVNRMRNYGSVFYMKQAQVDRFEVRGISDRLQCPYCAGMQGKTFEVSVAVNRINKIVEGGEQQLTTLSPFLTNGLEDMKGLTDEQITNKVARMSSSSLQGLGVEMPPYHPHCRDIIVAVL